MRLLLLVPVALSAGCSPVPLDPAASDTVWPGDFELSQPTELVRLSRLRRIEGSLVLRSTASLDTLNLPQLSDVEGDLVIAGLPVLDVPVRIELPELLTLGGGIRLEGLGDPVTVSLPKLGRADFLRASGGRFAFELDGLLELRGALELADGAIEQLDLPTLEVVEGSLRLRRLRTTDTTGEAEIPVRLPRLLRIGGGLELRGTTRMELTAPRLLSVGGGVSLDGALARLLLDGLQSLDGDLSIRESRFDFFAPTLERIAGRLEMDEGVFEGPPREDRLSSLRFPALTAVARALTVRRMQGLQGLEFPVLESVGGEVWVEQVPDLQRLDLQALPSVPADVHLEAVFDVEVRLDALTRVDGPFVIRTLRTLTLDAPRLRSVGQDLQLSVFEAEQLSLPALQTVGRSFVLQRASLPAELDLRALRTVGVDFGLEDTAGLAALSLPALERVGGGQGDSFGDLRVARNLDMAAVAVPRLVEVLGTLEFRDNPALDPERLDTSLAGVQAGRRTVCGNGAGTPCPTNESAGP